MNQNPHNAPNIVLLRGAALWLLMALVLAWCMVGLSLGVPFLKAVFLGKQTRLLQAHIDFLLMTALILGFYAARVPLHWSVRWAMVIGAFANSSLFLLESIFPVLDMPVPAEGLFPTVFHLYVFGSILTTTYGFGAAAITVFWSTFHRAPDNVFLEK
ncbi:MAG TPA: hypothetical protein VMU78_09490 [Methylocella sp.]|nr:hypothetical protein [Methylocella sp.]